ncbi:hypothetical protein H8E77_05495 [bacterium]|nr:hypothetical protein [bacterium]
MVKEALGHKSVETTRQYLGVSYKKLQSASKAIELSSNKTTVLLHSINEITTGDLIAELMARSIDMTSAIQQMKAERKTSDKIIRYPVQAERLYGTG